MLLPVGLAGAGMYPRLRAWLERVPLTDAVRRQQAVTLQILCFAALGWASATLLGIWRQGLFPAHWFECVVIALALPGFVTAIALIRTGRERAGRYTGVASISIAIALLLVQGLEYSLSRFAFVGVCLAAAGLLLGRRALWLVFLGSTVAVTVAALRDAGLLGGPWSMQRAPVPLGPFTQALFILTTSTVVLDRFGVLLRETLEKSLRREADLNSSEDRFRTLSSLGTEGVMVQSDGVILEANETFARMAAVAAPSVLIGHEGLDLVPFTPASREMVRERIQFGRDEPYEIELRRPDGTTWPAEVSARSILYGGRPARLVVMRDISQRRAIEAERARREAELRTSEERFRLVFETSPDAMNLVRVSDGIYVEVNDAFARVTGYGREEMVGRTSAERNLWVDRGQRDWLMGHLLSGEPLNNVEAEFRRKDGSVIHGLLSARAVSIAGTRYLLGIVRDVTDQRRAAREREALQEQLRQAQKLEAIGRLAGGVAHDFNNVLTSIRASVALVEEALSTDHPCLADVRQIGADAHRAAELTRQLLAFARKQETAPQVVRVEDRARSVKMMLQRVVGASIIIETPFAAESWPVFVDPGQLDQVILNLSVNARDAMPSGGRLTIATENVTAAAGDNLVGDPAPGEYVLLTVSDTGIGMPPEVVAHAFEPFFSTKGDQGTGLGLAICYGIITQAGGKIAIQTALGAGTRVHIYLPRAVVVLASAGEQQAVSLHGSETILLVDDDERMRRLATGSLEHLGYTVIAAGSASEAQAKFAAQAKDIDCLVMDLKVPDGEGRSAAARILDGRPDVSILFVSGSAEPLCAAGRESGDGCSFLAKAYTPIDLARGVRALLEPRGKIHREAPGKAR